MVNNSTNINKTKQSLNSDGQQFNINKTKQSLNSDGTNIDKAKQSLNSDGQQFYKYQQNKTKFKQ